MATRLADAALLARLVGFDSTSHRSNLPIADFVCNYLEHQGFSIIRNFNEDRTKVNVLACIGGDPMQKSVSAGLMLCGHLDVVPATEPDWRSDPFTLTETDSAYVGRGACDMKGFVALAVNAACRAAERSPKNPLALLFTFDEEPGTLGAQHFVRTRNAPFDLPRSCIVGEPTGLHVVRMHKGHLKMRITIHGQSAHSGYPHLGVNAIEPAARVVSALSVLRRELEWERFETSDHFPQTPFVALNVGAISGGSAVNMVPDRCVVEFGMRLLPGMEPGPLIERIRSAIEAVADIGRHSIEVTGLSPSLLLNENAEVYRGLCEIVDQRETFAVSYASDAGPLQELGLECALFGPGSIEVAHKANESMPKAEFVRAGAILDRVVQMFCSG